MSAMMPTLECKQIEVRYEEWVSPFAERTRRQLDDFATEHRLYSSLGLPQGPMLRAHSAVDDYMFPRAEPDRLYATGLMMVYFFIFDHIYDTDTSQSLSLIDLRERLAPNILRVIDGERCDADHFERAVTQIMSIFEDEDEQWSRGFRSRLSRYVEATLEGKDTARDRPQTTLEEYLELRQHDSGGLWSAYLIEYAHRLYLTPSKREHPDVVRASQLCMWTCSLMNDLFSYAKEREAEEAPFNALYFAMGSRGLSELAAAHYVCDQANRFLQEFEALAALPIFRSSEAMVSYTQGLREFISGVWHWHRGSGLYVHPRSLFVELRGQSISRPTPRAAHSA